MRDSITKDYLDDLYVRCVTILGKGKTVVGAWTFEEQAAIEQGASPLGLSTEEAFVQFGNQAVDMYMDQAAYWRGCRRGSGPTPSANIRR